MLPEVDPLPGAEHQAALCDWNRKARRRQNRLDVGRHVVGALRSVRVQRIPFGDESIQPVL